MNSRLILTDLKDNVNMMEKRMKFQIEETAKGLYTLDVRGLACPYPQLLVVRCLNQIASGNVLEVIIDNPPSVKDIPSALTEMGHLVDTIRLDSSTWKIRAQVKK